MLLQRVLKDIESLEEQLPGISTTTRRSKNGDDVLFAADYARYLMHEGMKSAGR
jgi:hypothetical protein